MDLVNVIVITFSSVLIGMLSVFQAAKSEEMRGFVFMFPAFIAWASYTLAIFFVVWQGAAPSLDFAYSPLVVLLAGGVVSFFLVRLLVRMPA